MGNSRCGALQGSKTQSINQSIVQSRVQSPGFTPTPKGTHYTKVYRDCGSIDEIGQGVAKFSNKIKFACFSLIKEVIHADWCDTKALVAGCTWTPCCVDCIEKCSYSANTTSCRQDQLMQWCVNIPIGECTILILTNVTVTVHTNHAINVP